MSDNPLLARARARRADRTLIRLQSNGRVTESDLAAMQNLLLVAEDEMHAARELFAKAESFVAEVRGHVADAQRRVVEDPVSERAPLSRRIPYLLAERGACSVEVIAEEMGLLPQTCRAVLENLEREGAVRRNEAGEWVGGA